MKLYTASLSILFSASLIGCTQKEFTGKALSSFLAPPDQCVPATKPTSESGIFASNKVQLIENSYGKESLQSLNAKASSTTISKGKKLVVEVDEACVNEQRQANSALSQEGLTSQFEITDLSGRAPASDSVIRSHPLELSADTDLADLQAQADADPCVRGIGEDIEFKLMGAVNDPSYSQQKHLPNIKAPEGWDIFFDATKGIKDDVVIAIIDSGVDLDHEDLRNNIWVNSKEVAGNGVDDDHNGYVDDVNGYNFASHKADPRPEPWSSGGQIHGTHVAGLSAAQSNNGIGVAGVMGQHVRIMALNVFGAQQGAQTSNIDDAIRYAADNGAKVINMSLGGRNQASSTGSALSYAISKGVMVVVAAGNDNTNIESVFYTPASFGYQYKGMVAIGATDANSNAKCGFSNFSSNYVEMAAPGCGGLYATVPGNAYQNLQGTSMASPVAAGTAALAVGLIKARSGNFVDAAKIEEVLLAGARVESGLTSPFKDGKVVDLKALGEEINKRYPASGTNPPDPGDNPPPKPTCP